MKFSISFLALVLLCSCTKTITKSDLDAKANEHNGFTFPDQSYYVGSDGDYDYFVIKRGLGGSMHRYRVTESEQVVTNRFDLTKDETRWRSYGISGALTTNILLLEKFHLIHCQRRQAYEKNDYEWLLKQSDANGVPAEILTAQQQMLKNFFATSQDMKVTSVETFNSANYKPFVEDN